MFVNAPRSQRQDILRANGFVGTGFHLQDDRAGFQRLHRVPLAGGDVHGNDRAVRGQFNSLRANPFQFVVELPYQPSAQARYRLSFSGVDGKEASKSVSMP